MPQPTIFLSHGSPQIILDSSAVRAFMASLGETLEKPRAIVVISAHWETHGLKVMATETPKTIHDFGGFDPLLYTMTYPVNGEANLAQHILSMLGAAGIAATLDTQRGLDHGAWIPLKLIYPEADIPVLQISIPKGATPKEMYDIGAAIAPLRNEDVLVIGSGSLTHNLYEFRGQDLDELPLKWVTAFADWMQEKIGEQNMAELLDYRHKAPFARENHPTEEHLLPLFAVLGAAGTEKLSSLHRSYNHAILAMDAYGTS